MASLISSLAKEIFQILKGSGRTLSLFDEHSNKVFDPEDASSFFAEPDKLMVTINKDGADSSLNMYISETSNVDEMKKMIDTMRITATRHNFLFNIRKYGKELNPKDFAFKATPVVESMYGSKKTSYQDVGKSKIIVRHSRNIAEDSRGARSRRIESIFVETAQGERFKFPNTSLSGARAFAKHIDSGGTPHDTFSSFIFKECDSQHVINGFRRRIKKLGESNEEIANIATTLKAVVDESKKKISKSKGNRFYTGIVEQITNAPNHIGPLRSEIAEKAEYLKTLLAIDETSALFPALESVAKTILEMNKMDPINFEEQTMLKSYMSEQAELIEDLVESLEGEFGLQEGVHFERSATGVTMLDEASFGSSQLIAEGINGIQLSENAQDKFLTYATSWIKARKGAAAKFGDTDMSDIHAQAVELATGLKQIITGNLPITIKNGDSPKFANPIAAIAYKLEKIIAPGSGLKNDSLWNYVSSIDDKLSHGDAMDANERFFAQKLADIVDKHTATSESILPEMAELDEWMSSYGLEEAGNPNAKFHRQEYRGVLAPNEEQALEKTLQAVDIQGYLSRCGSSDLQLDTLVNGSELAPEDKQVALNYIQDSVNHYFRLMLRDLHVDAENIELEPYVDDFIKTEVEPYLESLGFEVTLSEGLDETMFAEDAPENMDGMPEKLKSLVVKALQGMDKNHFGEIFGVDDVNEAVYELCRAIKAKIEDDLGLYDLTDYDIEIEQLAKQVWGQTNEGEELDEDATDDHAVEVIEAYKSYVEQIVHAGATNSLHGIDSSDFDPDNASDMVRSLVSDVLGHAEHEIESSYGNDWGSNFTDTDHEAKKEISAYIVELLADKYNFDPSWVKISEDSQLVERGMHDSHLSKLNMMQINDALDRILKSNTMSDADEAQYVEAMWDKLQDSFSHNINLNNAVQQSEPAFKQQIADFYKTHIGNSVEEGFEADMGDDFADDITYKGDTDEVAHIERLRKLAGI